MIAARLRHRLGRHDTRAVHDRLVREHAAGAASFLDVGCMWRIDGANAFAADEAGAARVTALDVMDPTPAFEARQRDSSVQFVQADIHDEGLPEWLGPHEVVWCSGVLYHVPDPLATIRQLAALTGRRLLLATEVLPARGRRAVWLPTRADHPGAPDRAPSSLDDYAPWYWLPSPAVVRSMLALAGLRVAHETGLGPYHRVFAADR
jgi:SAM-dependent methyltransferase